MPSGLGGPSLNPPPKRTPPRRGYPGVNPQRRRRAEVKVIDFNGMIRNLDWHPVYQAPWLRFHFGLAIGFRYKGLVFFGGGNGWNFYNLMFEAVRTVTNTTLPGLKLKVVRRSKSWKSTAGFQFFWGYLWHEAVEWEPVRRPNLQLDIWHLEVVFADLVDRLWIMLPRFASNTSKYTPGHEQQDREREREWKSRVECKQWKSCICCCKDTTNMLIIADERFVNIQALIGLMQSVPNQNEEGLAAASTSWEARSMQKDLSGP